MKCKHLWCYYVDFDVQGQIYDVQTCWHCDKVRLIKVFIVETNEVQK